MVEIPEKESLIWEKRLVKNAIGRRRKRDKRLSTLWPSCTK